MKKLKWPSNYKIGWWEDRQWLYLFHGTHERNLSAIANSAGLLAPSSGPTANWVSMALEPNTAHGYASMTGGESSFRAAGARAQTVPENERVVLVYKVPMSWIKSHMNTNMRGNIAWTKDRLINKDAYKKSGMSDSEWYMVTELRFPKIMPNAYLVGYMRKRGKSMSVNEDAPTNNVGSGNIAGAKGEPPVRRGKFAGHDTFIIDPDRFHKIRFGKTKYANYKNFVGEDEVGQEIRNYGNENPKSPLIVQCSRTGTCSYLRYGKL